MAGKFELFADAADKFRWRLKAGNGEVIAQSQAYASKEAAKKGIASVQTNSAGAALVDLTDAK
ncbi:YegP family protein [Nocardia sp. NPDC056000]|uniref:YegP family protein n=1 Tax=Nocardia sp. NPDC056000 TaxID=3345674 RepID=UPI0035DA52CA